MLRRLHLFCSALALAATACVPSAEEVEEFGENSPMFAIQEAGELVVAVPEDAPPFSSGEETSPEGFVVDLATDLAEALEVEVRYVEAESEEMIDLVAGPDPAEIGDEEAHIAFPLTTVTYETFRDVSRQQGFGLTTPFFTGHQRLLVPAGSDIESTEDLSGKTVCSLVDPQVGLPLDEVAPEAEGGDATTIEECARALAEEKIDAVMGSEVDLLQVRAEIQRLIDKDNEGPAGRPFFEIVGDDLTTQGYVPYVVRGLSAFSSDIFSEAQDDGRWTAAYETWIRPLSGETTAPPDLTLQELAALYPIES